MRPRVSLRSMAVWLGLAVSAAFTYLAIRKIDIAVFWDALATTDYRWLLPSFVAIAVTMVLRVLRWQWLFTPTRRPPFVPTASALFIGNLFNLILPARAGEAARVVALHQRAGTPRAEALATAVSERVYDVVILLALLFVATPVLPEVTWLRAAALLAVAVVALVVVVIAVLAVFGDRPIRFALRPAQWLPGISAKRVGIAAANVVHGLAAFVRPGVAIPALLLTLVSWLVFALSYWFLMLGFRLDLGYEAAVLAVIATNLALGLPSSPAGIGVFEAAALVALSAFGVGASEALSYAVVLHALNFFPFVALGYVFLHRHSVAVRRSRRSRPGYDVA